MAKDTGLREEKCLGELPERGLEAHTGYNGSGRESTKPPAGGRKFKIQNSKRKYGKLPTFPPCDNTKARQHESTSSRKARFPLPISFSLCLTAQTKRRPGYGLQPFSFDLLPAIHALAEVPFVEPI